MKKIILGMVLFLAPLIGFAEPPLVINKNLPKQMDTSIEEAKEKTCKSVLSISKTIMDGRQSGIPIERSLEIIGSHTKTNEDFYKMTKYLVIDAYNQPSFSSAEYKRKQLNDFSAKHYIACEKEMGLY